MLKLEQLIVGPAALVNSSSNSFRLGPLAYTLYAGEILIVIGPNGSGKSTLLRTLSGIQDSVSGSVTLNEKPTHTLPYGQRPLYVPPELQQDEWLRVCDVFDLFEAKTDAKFSNDLRFLQDLSSGERKRIFLEASFASKSPLIVLDEPNNFLDPRVALEWKRRIEEELQRGRSFVLSSHDLHWVLSFQKAKVCVLSKNEIEIVPVEKLVSSGVLSRAFDIKVRSFAEGAVGYVFDLE